MTEERDRRESKKPETLPENRKKPGNSALEAVVRCVTPLLLQYASAFTVGFILQMYFPDSAPARDATLRTAICDALIIPVLLFMYYSDRRREKQVRKSMQEEREAFGRSAAGVTAQKEKDETLPESRSAESRTSRAPGKGRASLHILAFFSGIALSILYSLAMSAFHLDRWFSNETQQTLLASSPAVQVVGLCLIAPAAEELIFRGLLYARLKTFIPRTAAMLVSSAIFALVHGNVIQMLYAFPMGLILAFFYDRADSVTGSMACHAGANFISVFLNLVLK